jgi:hypothetical protein
VKIIVYFIILLPAVFFMQAGAQEIPYDKRVRSFDEIPVVEDNRITILTSDMKRIQGNFLTYEMNVVSVRDDAAEVHTIAADEISHLRIEYDRSRRALRTGMWGGIIGLFAGIPIGAHQVNQRSDDESVSDAFIYIGSSIGAGIIGGLIGTGIGLAITPGDVVYKIEP